MHLTRPILAFALLLPACGPGGDSSESSATTSASEASADTTADTTADPSAGTTTDNPTTGTPPASSTSTTDAETGNTTGEIAPCPDDALPPEGSACALDGESCDPFPDPCDPYTYADCLDGTWHYVDVGPGDPNECTDSCDPFPEEGTPCNMEGTFCNNGCVNQCEFCNVVECSEGTWHALEVFPAPCLDCAGICEFTVTPMCAMGPPDTDTCIAGCMDSMAGPCSVEFSNMLACAGEMPTFTCDAMDRPLVEGCEQQFETLYTCLGI